jgi:hypothetical protein
MGHQQEGAFALCAEFDADVRFDTGQRVVDFPGPPQSG